MDNDDDNQEEKNSTAHHKKDENARVHRIEEEENDLQVAPSHAEVLPDHRVHSQPEPLEKDLKMSLQNKSGGDGNLETDHQVQQQAQRRVGCGQPFARLDGSLPSQHSSSTKTTKILSLAPRMEPSPALAGLGGSAASTSKQGSRTGHSHCSSSTSTSKTLSLAPRMEPDPSLAASGETTATSPQASWAGHSHSSSAGTSKTLSIAPGMEPPPSLSSSRGAPTSLNDPSPPQDSSQNQNVAAGTPSQPGAFRMRGSGAADDYGSDNADAIRWLSWASRKSSEKSHDTDGGQHLPTHPHVIGTATLVEEEEETNDSSPPAAPTGPLVVATAVKRSLFSDRRVQVAIGVVVLATVGLVVWALTTTRGSDDPFVLTSTPTVSLHPSQMPSMLPSSTPSTSAPSASPSMSPSFRPGTLMGRFCSQDPFNGYGGDFCPHSLPCRPCPSPNERLSVCLSEDSPIQVLQVYCASALQTLSRPCGINYPTCPLANYCIPCGSYVHAAGVLDGQVCIEPETAIGDSQEEPQDSTVAYEFGYFVCQFLKDNGGTFPPMPPPPTPEPTFSVAAFFIPVPTSAPTVAPSAGEETASMLEALLKSISLDGGEALETPGTPQSLAFEWLLVDPLLSEYTDEQTIQRYVLAVLYYSTGGDQWKTSSGWLSYFSNVCNWSFVTCDTADEQIVQLSLQNNALTGPLPPEIHLLDSLVFLGFYSNLLSGPLPTELGLLTKLVNMDLDSNKLEGVLPTQLGGLQDLQYLYLNNNQLTGSIPTDLGRLTNLQSLLLSNNQLTGSVPNAVCELGLGSLSVLSVDIEVECTCGSFVGTCHPVGS